ncbi:TPA: ABC transporter permease [Streptococcus suis]|nr:ABC transporter permease [Streptococcus suis]MCQ8266192.1 ABC transporter permease [Streptococcus suis]HEL1584607.1 ABC transporter permease [Streptococcus suis]HEL1640513.1 ABC transporter permease [Streptococcus suis]HEL9644954.1 ABC transporter permease [Streptococcus suis]
MTKYIIKRILQAIPLLLLISFIVFSLIYVAPFDVIDSMTTPNMTQEQIDLLKERNGLNQPFLIQYGIWLQQILSGQLGNSLLSQHSIAADLAEKIPNTVLLVLPSYLTALVLAIVLGLMAASQRGKWLDRVIDGFASLGIAVPTFWFAMLLIYFFGYRLQWFQFIGMHTLGQEGNLVDFLSHFILPYLTLIMAFMPELIRYIRSAAIIESGKEYVTVQEAFQANKREIFGRHILRNILVPIVTQIGLALPMLVTGALITETIFAWPGVGPYLTAATKSLDYPVIMAVMLLSATLVIIGNLLSDILHGLVDPRIWKGAE